MADGHGNGRAAQGIFWIGTISAAEWTPPTECPQEVQWVRGQREVGEGGFDHYQVFVAFRRKKRLRGVVTSMGGGYWQLSRSTAAQEYVWKEETRVPGTQFEFGVKPIQRNNKIDWESVWDLAQRGQIAAIPASIRVLSYSQLRRIGVDYQQPVAAERHCNVYWGATGTGKSRRAWAEAGSAFPKDPQTKFWCGYQGEEHVIIDEFRGAIGVAHILRWLDRYPVRVEVKGGSRPLMAVKYWITSNMDPKDWWPELDNATYMAFLRRVTIINFPE